MDGRLPSAEFRQVLALSLRPMYAEFARKLWSNQKLSNSRGYPRIRPHALAISASASGAPGPVEMKYFWGSVTSELSHSRRFDDVHAMSGLPPIATELRTSLEVRFHSDSVAKVFLSHRSQIFRAVGAAIEY